MKFLEKMWLMITLKVTKNLGFTHSLEDTFFEKKNISGKGRGGVPQSKVTPHLLQSF